MLVPFLGDYVGVGHDTRLENSQCIICLETKYPDKDHSHSRGKYSVFFF